MGYARPLGQTGLASANVYAIYGSVALIQFGILAENFRLCCRPISCLIEVQSVAKGDHFHPQLHGCVDRIAILAVSLVHASDFILVLLPPPRVIPKKFSGRFGKVAAMVYPGAFLDLL